MVKLLPVPPICTLQVCVGGNHMVKTLPCWFCRPYSSPLWVSEFRKDHSGPGPGSEMPTPGSHIPIPTVQQQNSVLFQEPGLISLGVCNEQVSTLCC